MTCRNPSKPEICLCPSDGNPRRALSYPFINGWLVEGQTRPANALADDLASSDERLWAMLFSLEDEASGAMMMWQSCQ